jgi:hypothetical protein
MVLIYEKKFFNFKIEKMWKKSVIHSNINVGFKIITCVLINYGKCKCNS